MKPILFLIIASFPYLFCNSSRLEMEHEIIYRVKQVTGSESDVAKVCYRAKNLELKKLKDVTIQIDTALRMVDVRIDTSSIAFYNLEKVDTIYYINNFPPLRKNLSYQDSAERRYRILAKQLNESELEIMLLNAENGTAPQNILSQPVRIILSKVNS